jgi:hypothetical protein
MLLRGTILPEQEHTEDLMDSHHVDGFAGPVIEEVSKHLKWKARGELVFDKDAAYFADLLQSRLASVPEGARQPVLERLVSYGQYLMHEQRAADASNTFMSGLQKAVGELPRSSAQPSVDKTQTGTWKFRVGRSRLQGGRKSSRVTLRGFRSW